MCLYSPFLASLFFSVQTAGVPPCAKTCVLVYQSLPSILGLDACLEPVLNCWMFGYFPVFYAWSCGEESVPVVFLTGVCGAPEVNET